MIVTPGQLSRRADFYHQLRQLTGAGLGLVRALEELKRHPPDRSYREPIGRVLDQIAGGATLTDGVQRCGHWLPEFDIALLQAGEHSGRLDAAFRLLADYYTDRARLARQMIGDLAYPVFLLHFAVFIFPFAQFFSSGNLAVYLRQTVGMLIPLYLVAGLMIFAAQSRHGETWRAWVEAFLRPVPVLGVARRYLALARLAAALEALLRSGVTIIQAWELAATASGSPALRRTVLGGGRWWMEARRQPRPSKLRAGFRKSSPPNMRPGKSADSSMTPWGGCTPITWKRGHASFMPSAAGRRARFISVSC